MGAVGGAWGYGVHPTISRPGADTKRGRHDEAYCLVIEHLELSCRVEPILDLRHLSDAESMLV